ncbi:alpha/beta hydrolase [Mycobacteroides abscessus]|uniref:alpha/beta hydrolase n=2 Tax=Mycobacteroides abscessus TaxID=36809 RepID=UPI0005E500BC|nr:alpha/beta hydrolase [Mycobacteroides abscessus]CPW41041.1 esterase/lipase [Mycobacteroides abscessus]
MMQKLARPPFAPELEPALAKLRKKVPATFTLEILDKVRGNPFTDPEVLQARMAELGLSRTDHTIAGYRGDDIGITVIGKKDRTGLGPGIYHTHGGGMVQGTSMDKIEDFFGAIERHDAVLVSVDYRLAPEFPDPYPVEDCYAGLLWMADHTQELGIDVSRILIGGASAGGGLAAGTALLARDRKGPKLIAQVLMCPMLDDRDATLSTHQMEGAFGGLNRSINAFDWAALLGERKGTGDVSIYAAPARATDLSGLPTTFIECGSAEVFRDEAISYATKLWEAGVQAELHVWAGGFHGYDTVAPHTAITQATVAARESWLDRVLGV